MAGNVPILICMLNQAKNSNVCVTVVLLQCSYNHLSVLLSSQKTMPSMYTCLKHILHTVPLQHVSFGV